MVVKRRFHFGSGNRLGSPLSSIDPLERHHAQDTCWIAPSGVRTLVIVFGMRFQQVRRSNAARFGCHVTINGDVQRPIGARLQIRATAAPAQPTVGCLQKYAALYGRPVLLLLKFGNVGMQGLAVGHLHVHISGNRSSSDAIQYFS